ncbi:hypothetical protein C8F01DRAFT_1152630 [Mycena amicta]|nr:hypothetical protein C8F01DRAFT_1152630 [Mycena amicta]
MTAVFYYGGDAAKEEWEAQIQRSSWLRHPNILQLYGIANSRQMFAALYHDELIPMDEILDRAHNSPLSRVRARVQWGMEYWPAYKHLKSSDPNAARQASAHFFRASTGTFCLYLTGSPWNASPPQYPALGTPPQLGDLNIWLANTDAAIVAAHSLQQLYEICGSRNVHAYEQGNILGWLRFPGKINWELKPALVAVGCNRYYELACIPGRCNVHLDESWRPPGSSSYGDWILTKMPNGWMRGALNRWHRVYARFTLQCNIGLTQVDGHFEYPQNKFNFPWFSQADHVFKSLGISGAERCRYRLLDRKEMTVHFDFPRHRRTPLRGYIFLCPSASAWDTTFPVEDIAYWSMDPSGNERLSADEATARGLPPFHVETRVGGLEFEELLYEEIRAIHEVKGFDPDSQDAAQYMGYPLFERVHPSCMPRQKFAFFDQDWVHEDCSVENLFRLQDNESRDGGNLAQSNHSLRVLELLLVLSIFLLVALAEAESIIECW